MMMVEAERKTVLVVEDERALRQALKDKFEKSGFVVLEAENGEEGLQLVQEQTPDLILLDLLMPVMSGMEMMRKLNSMDENTKKIPVIILSSLNPDDATAHDLIENEPSWYLLKTDWKLEDIVEKARSILGEESEA